MPYSELPAARLAHQKRVSPAAMLSPLSALEIHEPLFWSFSLFLEDISWFHTLSCNWILHIPWLNADG